MTLVYIILSTTIISLASLVGVFFISLREELFQKIIFSLVIFATGVLLGGAILHLLPEAFESVVNAPLWVLAGIVVFFILEKYLFWRHCHDEHCHIHPFRYLNLIGDGMHNFVDGTIIAAAFVTDIRLGITTSILVLAHEIPQEMGDFGILVYGGFSRARALFFNLVSAVTCVIGGIVAYFFAGKIHNLAPILIAFAGGNFLYMALVDLLPELRKPAKAKESVFQLMLLCLGIFFMWLLTFVH